MIEGPSAARGGPKLRGWQGWAARVQEAPERLSRWLTPARQPADPFLARLQLADRLMWVVLGALGVYVLGDLFFHPAQVPALPSAQTVAGDAAPLTQDGLAPVAQYQDAIAGRNPFNLSSKRSTGDLKETSARQKLEALTKSLSVVGINRGRIPEALIEDAEAKRTHFVKVGDTLNGLTVAAIDASGVMVEYDGEETLLK
ncbi:MAG: hypothetical protein Q8S13_02835 [Dehalococcoidia bacterium]|nr:hypothetical protein [Dehalococcoidia bacterium]